MEKPHKRKRPWNPATIYSTHKRKRKTAEEAAKRHPEQEHENETAGACDCFSQTLEQKQDSLNLVLSPHLVANCSISLSIHRSNCVPAHAMKDCFELIKRTSFADYKASSMGWHPGEKKKEMADKNMWYLLIHELKSTATSPSHSSLASADSESPPPHSQSADAPIFGFLSFMFTNDDPPFADRPVIYIYEIHLAESMRGLGLGSHLMKMVESIARSVGLGKLMLTVFSSNKGARRLYEKLGYTKDQCSPPDREVRGRVIEADYVIMNKELEKQDETPAQ